MFETILLPVDLSDRALAAAGDGPRDWVAAEVTDGTEANPHILHGRVYDEVLSAAVEFQAHAIVMAAQEDRAAGDLVGRDADRVARDASASVLTVRDDGS